MLLKRQKFPLKLFISTSLICFTLFFILLLLGKAILRNSSESDDLSSGKKLAKNSGFFASDPFITKTSRFKKKLAKPLIADSDPLIGKSDAPLKIIIFSDFQCAFCREQEAALNEIIKKYADKVGSIRKDYPEADFHSTSFKAAIAGRCAQEQNKFWSYHNKLLNGNYLKREAFNELAEELGLNLKNFKSCLNSDRPKKLIMENIKEADSLEITGVPFIYVNDKEVMGQISLEELEEIVEDELK